MDNWTGLSCTSTQMIVCVCLQTRQEHQDKQPARGSVADQVI